MEENNRVKLVIGVTTALAVLVIIGCMIGKNVFLNHQRKNAPTSETESIKEEKERPEIAFEDEYDLNGYLKDITEDTIPFSVIMAFKGTYSYAGTESVGYTMETKAITTQKTSEPEWIKIESSATMSLSVGKEKGTPVENTEVSYLYHTDEIHKEYASTDTGIWFYEETAVSKEEAPIPWTDEFLRYLYNHIEKVTEKEDKRTITILVQTRDEDLVDILNDINSEEFTDTIFAGLTKYNTEVKLTLVQKTGKASSYTIECPDKDTAFAYYMEKLGQDQEKAIVSSAGLKIALEPPKNEEFDVPGNVINAIPEEEWLEMEEEIPSEEEPETEEPSEEPVEEEKEPEKERPDITNVDSVFAYLKKTLKPEEEKKEEAAEGEEPLTTEEIWEIYGDSLTELWEKYKKEHPIDEE